MRDAPGGLQRLALARIGDPQAVAPAVAQRLDDALGEMRHVDHRFSVARLGEALEVPRDERLAACGDHGLRNRISQWPQTLTPSGSENHHSHFNSSNNRVRGARAEYRLATSRAYRMKRGVSARYLGLPSR